MRPAARAIAQLIDMLVAYKMFFSFSLSSVFDETVLSKGVH